MPTFLHIDTALENATVALSKGTTTLAIAQNKTPNTHAEFVQPAIESLLTETALTWEQIAAIVVTLGPGSYTGLRVGLASAKGIAYAINKPLIGLSTLALLHKKATNEIAQEDLNCRIFSMIDARRMEVFGAVYDQAGKPIIAEQAIVLDTAYMEHLLAEKSPLYCIGSGVAKTQSMMQAPNLHFMSSSYGIRESIELASIKFEAAQFEDLAYTTPTYIKEFYIATSNKI